jgi:effector-binding domain-containing protein
MNENEIDMECGIPVEKQIEVKEPFLSGKQDNIRCAVLQYFGDYSNLEKGHTQLQQWIGTHKFKLAGSPIEVYITDPDTESNPENWQTNIYYPIY